MSSCLVDRRSEHANHERVQQEELDRRKRPAAMPDQQILADQHDGHEQQQGAPSPPETRSGHSDGWHDGTFSLSTFATGIFPSPGGKASMTDWDQRFRAGEYPTDPDPAPLLREYQDDLPTGRALDIATGTGRNAVFLAEAGYDVDALDSSLEGLKIARENARKRGVEDRCNWIQADAFDFDYPPATYDLITIRSFRILDRLPDIKAALAPDGVLYYQMHVRTEDPVDYGPSDHHRVAANELLRAALDLTVLVYREYVTGPPGNRGAYAQLLARNSSGHTQALPHRDD